MKNIALLLIVALAAAFAACAKKEAKPSVVVITSASGAAVVIRTSGSVPATTRLVLSAGDSIQTKEGSLDLQIRGGSTVRIRPFTSVAMARLLEGDIRLALNDGSLVARVKKSSSAQNFSVVSPTAIAGVRGTTFSMEVTEGSAPKVRVLDGMVAMVPRIPALEKYSEEQIEKNPALKELSSRLEKQEIVLTEKTEGTIDPATEAKIKKADADLTGKGEAALKDVKLEEIAPAAGVQSKKVAISPQEEAEKETIVTVSDSLIDEAAKGTQKQIQETAKKIDAEHEQKLNKAFDTIGEKAAEKKLTSVKEIKEYYQVLEEVTMKDQKRRSGAIVAQAGNVLMFHTVEGVFRLNKQEVQYVDYYNVKK